MSECEANEWRETVRDIYDMLHLGNYDDITASIVIALIERRHAEFFGMKRDDDG